jgi:NADH:ubiquinone oxidoreductase subunit
MKFLSKILDTMTKLQIRLHTFRAGKFIGIDEFGNRYFEDKNPKNEKRISRWVLYKDEQEATKIPPEWDGWLHHMTKEPLKKQGKFHKNWMKDNQENLTGLLKAYRPSGHILNKGQRPKATGDYKAWSPSSSSK